MAELTCGAVAVGATVMLESVRGRRELAVTEFLLANMMNAREPDELVVEVRFPTQRPGTLSGFAEFARKVADFPLVTAAAQLELDGARCLAARIAVGGVGPAPMRLAECESRIQGSEPAPDVLDGGAALAAELVDPADTPFVSREYRRVLTRVVVRRALEDALTSR